MTSSRYPLIAQLGLLLRRAACAATAIVSLSAVAGPQERPVKFDVPAAEATTSLRQFATQAGEQIMFSDDAAAGVKTRSVRGIMTAREAIDHMLADTDLTAIKDDKTGAYSIRKMTPAEKNGARAIANSDRPSAKRYEVETNPGGEKVIKLDTFEVFGRKTLNMDIRGSRDDAQPYVIFEREAIERAGANNLEDFLKSRLTMNAIGSTNSQLASVLGSVGQVNLRGLGTGQTLILIDGRRAASAAISPPSQSDLNGIPLAAIERVEVLPTTASGIYGGAATGGVINIVLRRDYAGTELKTTYQNSFDTDSAMVQVDLSAGFNLEDGKTNVLLTASWSERQGLLASDRNFLVNGRARVLANNPAFYLNAINPPLGRTTNIRSVNGSPLFGPGTPNYTYVPEGYAGGGGLAPLQANAGRYNFTPADNASYNNGHSQSLLNEPKIVSASLAVRRQFTERIQAFFNLSMARNTGRFLTNNVINNYTIPSTAPNNPFGQAIRVTVPIQQGDKATIVENDNDRVVAGIIAGLPWENWQMSADYSWERSGGSYENAWFSGTEAALIASGAIDVLRDLNRFPADFSPYLARSALSPREVNTHSGTVRIAGPIGQLPGGAPTLSALMEYRDEHFGATTTTTGPTSLFLPSRSQRISSAYLESRLPLWKSVDAWLRECELQLAGRWDRYDVFGATGFLPVPVIGTVERRTNRSDSLNPTAGLRLVVPAGVTLRASFGTGFLPPNANQLILTCSPETGVA